MDFKKIQKDIAEYGCSIIAIESTDYLPSYAHSIGLWEQYQHPEIILFGLPPSMMQQVLNEAAALIKDGEKITVAQSYTDFFENGQATCIAVDERNIPDYFAYAIQYYQGLPFDAVQLVWTDRHYKLPWEENFETEFKHKQPLLDRNADFKFSEDKDLIVLRSIAEDKVLLKVIHDAEGNWHFLSSADDANLKENTLGDLVAQDMSLNDLFDLDYGQMAERKSREDKWERRLL